MKASILFTSLASSITLAGALDVCTVTSILPASYTVTAAVSTYNPSAANPVYTSIYNTTLLAVGPTGLYSAVYPVTNIGTGTNAINPATVPPGFTTAAVICTACPGQSTVTVTTPIAGATGAVKASSAVAVVASSAAAGVSSALGTSATAGPSASQFTGDSSSTFVDRGLVVLSSFLMGLFLI